MVARNRRKLPDLRRVTGYVTPEEYAWVESYAQSEGWTISKAIAVFVASAHVAEQGYLKRWEEEALAGEGRI